MRQRRLLVPATAIALSICSLVLIWRLRWLRIEPPASPAGWEVAAGALDPEAERGDGPRRFRASGEVELRSGRARLLLAPGSRVELPPSGASPSALPRLLSGSMELTTVDPLAIDGQPLRPLGEGRIEITPELMTLLDGSFEWSRQVFHRGQSIVLRPDVSAPDRKGRSPEDSGEAGPPEDPPSGQVVDARDGAPLAGASVRATFCVTDDGDSTFPEPEGRAVLSTDGSGRFRLPRFRPGDPRLRVHLEADHPDFLPLTQMVESESDLEGRFPFVTLWMRGGRARGVLIRAPDGSPLPWAALEVRRDPADAFLGEDTWEEGRTWRPDRPLIRFTGPDGTIRLPWEVVGLSLRNPFLHIFDAVPHRLLLDGGWLLPNPVDVLWLDLRAQRDGLLAGDPAVAIETAPGSPARYALRDRDGLPVAGALIEIALQGQPAARLFTDDAGTFEFAAMPYPRSVFQAKPNELFLLSPENPRRGTLLVLDPLYWKKEIPVAFPSLAEVFLLADRRAGRLSFRLREEAGAEEEPLAVPARGVSISEDLTLVWRDAQGEVVYEGGIPPSETPLRILARDRVPVVVPIPPHPAGGIDLDLGEILLDRGGELSARLDGGSPALYERARLWVAERDLSHLAREYRVDQAGGAVVGGLVEGVAYLYAVDGSGIERSEGEFLYSSQLGREGLAVTLSPRQETETLLAARALLPEAGSGVEEISPDYRVVERYYFADAREPIACASYPVPPDRILGSRRVLPSLPLRAEVLILGPANLMGRALQDRRAGGAEFDLGRILLREGPHALLSFIAPGVGRVGPPRPTTLVADRDRNHEIVRQSELNSGLLRLDFLLPGRYTLRWEGEGGAAEAFEFEVKPSDTEVRREVPRRALAIEEIEIEVVDTEGKGLPGVKVEKEAEPGVFIPVPEAGASSGWYRLPVATRQANRFRFTLEGFLRALLELPAETAVPARLVLEAGARVQAMVLDPDGLPFTGFLTASFQPEAAGGPTAESPTARVVLGDPLTIAVTKGGLESDAFPPGGQRVSFQGQGSAARAEGVFLIHRGRTTPLGKIRLTETRSLEGLLRYPGGEPAPEAVVALVEPSKALRFPLRSDDLRGTPYSARTDALGRFRIDGLPLALAKPLALLGRLPGYNDAVESPVDLDAERHLLYLSPSTSLVLEAGYLEGEEIPGYEFRLQYLGSGEDPADLVDLGPLPPTPRGGKLHEGIAPGRYRLLWNLLEPAPGLHPRSIETVVAPGVPARLSLRIEARSVPGEAFLNGQRLARGWLILVTDPLRADGLMAARVAQGRFEVPVPLRAETAHAALIPDGDTVPQPDFERGLALPHELRNFQSQVSRRFLSVEQLSATLTIKPLSGSTLANVEIEFPHYRATANGYRKEVRREPFPAEGLRLPLLPRGSFSFKILVRGSTHLLETVDLEADLEVPVRF